MPELEPRFKSSCWAVIEDWHICPRPGHRGGRGSSGFSSSPAQPSSSPAQPGSAQTSTCGQLATAPRLMSRNEPRSRFKHRAAEVTHPSSTFQTFLQPVPKERGEKSRKILAPLSLPRTRDEWEQQMFPRQWKVNFLEKLEQERAGGWRKQQRNQSCTFNPRI